MNYGLVKENRYRMEHTGINLAMDNVLMHGTEHDIPLTLEISFMYRNMKRSVNC